MTKDIQAVFSKKLANNIIINVFDRSRTIVGDRWLVELECIATVPVLEDLRNKACRTNSTTSDIIKEEIPTELTHCSKMTRHFVDEAEKETVWLEMIHQLESTIFVYLAKPTFPEKLFYRELAKLKKQSLNNAHPPEPPPQQDDEEPADFSHCFKA